MSKGIQKEQATMNDETDNAPVVTTVKRSVVFDKPEYDWATARSEELYGRRGFGLYLRKLVREDHKAHLITKGDHAQG